MIHSINSGVLRKGCFSIELWEPKEIPLASCCWTKCSKHLCVGVDLCTIGNIYVSIALFGDGNVISIVLLKKMCRERIFIFLFVQFEFCLLGILFFIVIIIIDFFFFFTSSLSIMFSGNRKQNKHQQA